LTDAQLHEQVFPFVLRPQAHEIIRTWTFYTILKSLYHFGRLPWNVVAISGWGLAAEGAGKISKSRGGGPMPPMQMIERYSADAVRYWTSSTGFGKDSIINEEKIQAGARLVTKLWNVARFSERFLEHYQPSTECPTLSPTDRWLLSRTQRLILRVTELFRNYDYAAAKSEIEAFFWRDLADNYLEMSKERLYTENSENREGALYTLYYVLLTVIKLFAPFFPYITEKLYQALFTRDAWKDSLHNTSWPIADESLIDKVAEEASEAIIEIATAVRRYKSESNISLGTELQRLQLATSEPSLISLLHEATKDIMSVTRARKVETGASLDPDLEVVKAKGTITVALVR
jgi:valyl-tRNA synthetase